MKTFVERHAARIRGHLSCFDCVVIKAQHARILDGEVLHRGVGVRELPAPEPVDLEARWRSLTAAFTSGQTAETDAYLAAFALTTLDRGFRRFDGLDAEILGG